MREISQAGLDLIKQFEGLRLQSYQDGAGVWTIGYGHTGKDVTPDQRISEEVADALLLRDLTVARCGVQTLLTASATDDEFAAMVSLAFNVGVHAFACSTLLRKFNTHDTQGAAAEFVKWDIIARRPSLGLLKRRRAEQAMFLGEAA